MGRNKIYKDGKERIGVDLSPDELERFEEIRWRERKGKNELARIAILDYIKAHASGNTTYTLDDFGKHKDMIAIPALMANRQDLSKYVKEEYDSRELKKVKEQCEFLVGVINTKLLNTTKDNDAEEKRIQAIRNERFRRQNDIRYKDPSKMSWNERIRYAQIMNWVKETEEIK